MTVEERSAIRREVRVGARPETIFALLTDPAKYVRWKGAVATLDPRPGGVYRVQFNSRDIARGTYVEVVPFRRVIFTWGWEGGKEGTSPVPPGSSTVEITLTPDGDGTIVRLVHRDLPEEARDKHMQGWELYLNRLAITASGGDPGPDPNQEAGKM
ncbi:MAG: transcriptional regulator [Bacillati bacterium ANGP1]|uniref:Transcriptional regulator n=1 Tax=Candidatus Segetimicrobium genomatis TaxID=2569760 RepID=A0A537KZ23_9BACT|nr:MAG: transcriptional regulator [Terrabacteria group bacterium ANGP1]